VDFLSADDLGEIMRAMGFRPTEDELKELLAEIDEVRQRAGCSEAQRLTR
jgi:Ca2+-binding EF-hand superfamily protein